MRAALLVCERAILPCVPVRLQTADEVGDLDDDHVQRRRLERLDEAVGVADGHGVALPELPVPAAPEAQRPGLAEARILGPHLRQCRVWGEGGGRVDVAAVVLALAGDA